MLDQDGWMHAPMEEALLLSDRLAASLSQQAESATPTSPAYSTPQGLSLIQEEPFLRSSAHRPGSLPPGASSLRASMSSVHSARDPLMVAGPHRHLSGLGPPPSFHSIPPFRSPPGVSVQPMGGEMKGFGEEFARPGHSLPHRSKSERALPRPTTEFRPRAQTGDKSTMPAAPEATVAKKCESEPVNVDSIQLEMVSERGSRHSTSSRDSIQLIASPVVKLRTSSDEDSAVHSDNCDSNSATDSAKRTNSGESNVNTSNNNNNNNNINNSQESVSQKVLSETNDNLRDEEMQPSFKFSPELSPQSGDGASGVENSEGVTFRVGSYILGSGATKDSSSSESSNRSKSRGSSFNTNTDSTSGVGSCDSNRLIPGGTQALKSNSALTSTSSSTSSVLTPIPSSSSLSTLVSSSSVLQAVNEQEAEPVHHSALQRSLFHLTRVPSYKRRSASPAIGGSQSASTQHLTANGGFTSPRDVLGYAALRSIKRQRAHSSETEADPSVASKSSTHLDPSALLRRTISQDSEVSLDSNMWLR